MRYAVLSDVHASLEALDAVLDATRARGAERVVCLGDVVGYHADPEPASRCCASTPPCASRVTTIASPPGSPSRRLRRRRPPRRALDARAPRAREPRLPRRPAAPAVVDGRFLLFHGALTPRPTRPHLSSAARVRRSIQALGTGPGRWPRVLRPHPPGGRPRGARRRVELAREGGTMSSVGRPRPRQPGQRGTAARRRSPRLVRSVDAANAPPAAFRRVPFYREACLAKAARAGLSGGGPRARLSASASRALAEARVSAPLGAPRSRRRAGSRRASSTGCSGCARAPGRRALAVLTYHRVGRADGAGELDPGLFEVTPAELAAQLEVLRTRAHRRVARRRAPLLPRPPPAAQRGAGHLRRRLRRGARRRASPSSAAPACRRPSSSPPRSPTPGGSSGGIASGS